MPIPSRRGVSVRAAARARSPLIPEFKALRIEQLEERRLLSVTGTVTSMAASAAALLYGDSVDLTATVTSLDPDIQSPSEGTVTFLDNGVSIGSAAVSSGSAALTNLVLPLGSHLITAAYTDPLGYYADSQSTTLGPESIITTIAGTGMRGYSGDQGPATQAELSAPDDVAVDAAGNIFIADTQNNVVRRVDHSTGLISTVAGNGYTDIYGMGGFSGDGGPATDAELSWPVSVAVDAAGNLFISDEGNSRIREVNQATGVITTVVGNGTNGDTGDGGPATSAAISNVCSIVLDVAGDLFLADRYDGVVREVNAATGEIATIAGVPGSFQFGGDGGPATSATFMTPDGLAVDSAGDLFIADYSTQRVRVVNHTTGVITTVAGNGIQGNTGDGGPATSAEISAVAGICVDVAGNLYIADYPGLIREVAAGSGTISTIAGNGNFGFAGDGGPAIEAELFVPNDIALDSAGNLVVADTGNQRIRQINAGAGGVTVTVSQATTAIAVTASTATVLDGETVDLTATVSPVDTGAPSPSEGTVTFLDNGVSLGSAAVVGGTALQAGRLAVARPPQYHGQLQRPRGQFRRQQHDRWAQFRRLNSGRQSVRGILRRRWTGRGR